MKKIINFNISYGEKYYVAECNDLAIVTQGKTLDETIFNIKEALNLHLLDENLDELNYHSSPAININIDLGELEYA